MKAHKLLQMSNLLIGSSNVDRFYKATLFSNFRQYKMVKCTQMSGFLAYMNTLKAGSKCVLISIIENFIIDGVGADIIEPENAINKCINNFLLIIQTMANKYPKVKFGIAMPLRRPAILWYQERVDQITNFLCDGVKEMISVKSVNNVVTISCPSEASQQFDSDMVHLTKPSAKIFLEIILESAKKFFEADMVDLTEVQDSDSDLIKNLEDRLARLEKSMLDQANKNVANDLMFARSREETDAVMNRIKEDRLVMNGLKSPSPLPSDQRNKIECGHFCNSDP